MRYRAITATLAVVVLVCGGCDREQAEAVRPPSPVVVYAGLQATEPVQALLANFREESGVVVILREGSPGRMVDDLLANTITPPADILWVAGAAEAWRAAEEGALRPIGSAAITGRVPAALRDPDDFWLAMTVTRAQIAYRGNAMDAGAFDDFAALADDSFRGRLCLSSSSSAINRAVLSSLIETLGIRPAELAVRGWVANLARPVLPGGREVLERVTAGDCAVGIVPDTVADAADPGVVLLTPEPAVVDIEALGIARHARNPGGALALLDWLTRQDVQARYAESAAGRPAAGERSRLRDVLFVAVHEAEARRLAERARYP